MHKYDIEVFLAKLYTDQIFLDKFVNAPQEILSTLEMTDQEKLSIASLDINDLIITTKCFKTKRDSHSKKNK